MQNQAAQTCGSSQSHAEHEAEQRRLLERGNEVNMKAMGINEPLRRFDALKESEQIQILRSELLQLRHAHHYLQQSLEEVLGHFRTFLQHEHVNGKVMTPAGNASFATRGNAKLARSYDPLA